MTRLRFLLFFIFLFAINSNILFAKETLRILAWAGYADQDWVAEFEKMTNSTVEVTIINTDDDLWLKLNKNHGQDYDVFTANTAELQRYIDNKIASPINLNHIPNTKNQLARFQKLEKSPQLMRDNLTYAIPFTYSEMGLIYNRKLLQKPPTTMGDLWDPKYKGKILLYDGTVHNFSYTALVLGIKNPFQLSENDYDRVVRKLVNLRDNDPLFYTSPEAGTKKFIENKIALMYGNYGAQQVKQLRAKGANVGYIIPSEGALAWLDCWIVTSPTKARKLANKWINFTLSERISSQLSKRQGLANTLTKVSFKSSDKIVWLEPVENNDKRTNLWNRVRKDNARIRDK
jgi:putative spermidine/putrescine transport system substrate-binding protein